MQPRKTKAATSATKAAKPLRSKAEPSVSKRAEPIPEPNHQDEKMRQVTVRLRPALKKAIETEARARELTVQALFLLGVRELGLPVTENDLQDRRKPGGGSSKSAAGAARASGRRERSQQRASHHGGHEHLIRLGLQALGEQNLHAPGTPTIIVVSSGCKCG